MALSSHESLYVASLSPSEGEQEIGSDLFCGNCLVEVRVVSFFGPEGCHEIRECVDGMRPSTVVSTSVTNQIFSLITKDINHRNDPKSLVYLPLKTEHSPYGARHAEIQVVDGKFRVFVVSNKEINGEPCVSHHVVNFKVTPTFPHLEFSASEDPHNQTPGNNKTNENTL
jgi:hypothetical protein